MYDKAKEAGPRRAFFGHSMSPNYFLHFNSIHESYYDWKRCVETQEMTVIFAGNNMLCSCSPVYISTCSTPELYRSSLFPPEDEHLLLTMNRRMSDMR